MKSPNLASMPGAPKKQDSGPQIGPVRKALKEHSKLCDDFYKFPEPSTPVADPTAKAALVQNAYQAKSDQGKAYFSEVVGTENRATSYGNLTPTPLTAKFTPVEKSKNWTSALSLTRAGVPRPAILDTGKKGFLESWQLGRHRLTGGMVGETTAQQSEKLGEMQGMIDAITKDADLIHSSDKAVLNQNLDKEVAAQKNGLLDFYFGTGNARVNADNTINLINNDPTKNQNFEKFCDAYGFTAAATDSPAEQKQKQDDALAAIASQMQAIDDNAALIRKNIDKIQTTEKRNLDKDLENEKELKLRNMHTQSVNTQKKDVFPDRRPDAVLQAENGSYKVPESKIKDFNVGGIGGIGGTRVTEDVDANGSKSYKFHRRNKEEEAEKYNILNPLNAPQAIGAATAIGFRIGITAVAFVLFPPSIFFTLGGLKADIKEDIGKFTLRGPFADTREKRDFDKFLDLVIQPGHATVTANEELTPAEQRQLWLKANTINPSPPAKHPMKVMIGHHEYKPTASDVRQLEKMQQEQTKKIQTESAKAAKAAHADVIDGLLQRGQLDLLTDDLKKDMSKEQKEQYRTIRDVKTWAEEKFKSSDADANLFKDWWKEEGKKEFETWDKSLSSKKELSDYQQSNKPTNDKIGQNINHDKLDTWFDKEKVSDKFEAYKAEHPQGFTPT